MATSQGSIHSLVLWAVAESWHIQDGSHINVKHIWCACLQHPYDVHVHMEDESLPCCHCSCWPSFWKLTWIMVTLSQWANHSVVLWLRLLTYSKWVPHQCQNNCRLHNCNSSYALDVHVDDSLPNRPCSHWPSFWKLPRILATSRGQNKAKFSCWGSIDTFKMAPTSMSNTWDVFHNLYMLWMCIWMSLTTLPLLMLTKLIWKLPRILVASRGLKEFWWPPEDQTKDSFVVEAIDTFKITLPLHQCQTSYRGVSQPPYALYEHHMDELYHILTAHIGQAFGSFT